MAYRFPFPPYPNGWFAIAFSLEIAPGAISTRRAFGREILLYRTHSGQLAASDPHCPHVGAHLGVGGQVVGERLRCPFHAWCFDAAGECVEVPGAERIPPRARLSTWPLVEANGLVFVHHDDARRAPAWPQPVLDDAGWSRDRTILWTVRTHPQDVFENTVDAAHLVPLHGCRRATIERAPVCDAHNLRIGINLIADGAIVGMPGVENDVLLDVTMHGLGQAVVESSVRNAGIHARQRIYCTPIDEERSEIRGVVQVRSLGDEAVTEQVAELFFQAYVTDFALDFPVWENKVYRDRPLLSTADGPFMLYRRWARQFYGAGEAPLAEAAGA